MLYNRRVLIYGAGYIGTRTLAALQENGIEVAGFIDSDETKVGSMLCGKKICNKKILKEVSADVAVIAAGRYAHEIAFEISDINEKLMRFIIFDWPFSSPEIWVNRERGIMLRLAALVPLQEYCEKNKVSEMILYGNDVSLAEQFAEVYECLDFSPVSIVTDGRCDMAGNVGIIDEVLYRNHPYLILLYEEQEVSYINKLKILELHRKCVYVNYEYSLRFYYREGMLDVNLGYTYETNFQYPGIYVYGSGRKKDYKIAVLGGSTTDSELSPEIRSWVEIMYHEYNCKDITIYNGAISGYNSPQELLKLFRDMMKLEPDLVLVYDGFNDILMDLENPFWYLESLVRFAGKHIRCFERYIRNVSIWKGIKHKGDVVDNWLENIQYMHTIAKSQNAEFLSFIQPMLFTKKYLDKHSDSLLQMLLHIYSRDTIELAKKLRESAEKITNTHSYITDLSYIFDDVDVYMDSCHVYEKGNAIIAGEIWNTIKEYVKKGKRSLNAGIQQTEQVRR